jgi:hypothetical protein
MQDRILGATLFFLIVFLTGVWLGQSGRPFNELLMSVHKLISFAAVVFLFLVFLHLYRDGGFSRMEWVACMAAGVSFLAAFVSGGVVTAQERAPTAFLAVHWIAPFVALLSTAAAFALFLLQGR